MKSIEASLKESHVWKKCKKILLVFYSRDKELPKYDQTIGYVALFTPPESDLAIIEDDYKTIQKYITEGRADELSESLTRYLGACTKGANAEKGNREQTTYAPGKFARSRAWCLKNSYMNSVFHNYILGDEGGDSIVKDPSQLKNQSFEELVLSLIEPYIGRNDSELFEEFDIVKNSKNKWARLTNRMLGVKSERAEEFDKAGVQTKTIRIEESDTIAEDISFPTFKFKELIEESWEESQLHALFEETRFLFIVFKKVGDNYILKGARFWSMPVKDIEGPLHDCWQATIHCAKEAVELTPKNGRIKSNLPGKSDNPVAHVRPHATAAAYKLEDGTVIGNISRDADELPDGRWMTKQCFWLNKGYVYEFVKDFI